MTKISIIFAIGIAAVFLMGSGRAEAEQDRPAAPDRDSVQSAVSAFPYKPEDMDASWPADAARITLSGGGVQINGRGASAAGTTVTITKAGTYALSGVLDDGCIIVDAGKQALVRLVLNGVRLSSSTGSPLYLKQAKKTVLVLPDASENVIVDAASYVFPEGKDEPDAAVFAHDDLSIAGGGSLSVNGRYRNGIASKDKLVITGGSITVSAVNDGLRGRDALAVLDGVLVVEAGNDGLKANNDKDADKGIVALDGGSYTIRTGRDGVQAETALIVTGGSFNITTGGGAAAAPVPLRRGWRSPPPPDPNEESESKKALKAGTELRISGGVFMIDAEDDAVHVNGNAAVSGGNFSIKTGDDAFHADTMLSIDGGDIMIASCVEGLEGAHVEIRGGSINLTALDDGINAAGGADGDHPRGRFARSGDYYVKISGGTLDVLAMGDGIDANGDVFLEGGDSKISGPSMGMQGAVDFDGRFVITGGRLITAGSSLPPARESTQPSLLFAFSSRVETGSVITLQDGSGRTLLDYSARTACNAAAFTSPELRSEKNYTLLVDGRKRGEIKLSGMVTMIAEGGGSYNIGERRR